MRLLPGPDRRILFRMGLIACNVETFHLGVLTLFLDMPPLGEVLDQFCGRQCGRRQA
jgi:hypothetical protein